MSAQNHTSHAPRTAILLINVGTPASPKVGDVRRYLSQFLSDGRVIDLPWLGRQLLVNGIIVPFRAPKSAKLYQQLWTDKGSPLLTYGMALRDALQQKVSPHTDVYVSMRYGTPSIKATLAQIDAQRYARLTVVPLFPHYASSTTGTAVEEVMRWVRKQNVIPQIKVVNQFFNHDAFIDAFARRIDASNPYQYDHVLFSYHGLPKRHVNRTHAGHTCEELGCANHYGHDNAFCYHAACHETTRLIVAKLNLSLPVTTAFQSRLGKGWLEPFADVTIEALARQGVKKLLVVSPAFVADCLETVIEIGVEYKERFEANGGQHLTLVESLNDMPQWVDALNRIIEAD